MAIGGYYRSHDRVQRSCCSDGPNGVRDRWGNPVCLPIEGRSGPNRRWPPRTSKDQCFLLTPNLVRGSIESQRIVPEVEPRTWFQETPNVVPENPEPGSPNCSNHHQEERANKNGAKRKLPVSAVCSPSAQNPEPAFNTFSPDDDDQTCTRTPITDQPDAEFRERLKERLWKTGPLSETEIESIVQFVQRGLPRFSQFIDFLIYEASSTSPEQVHSPGAHYRSLLQRFQGARTQVDAIRRKEIEANWRSKTEPELPPQPVCMLGKCNGRGEVYAGGILMGICECEAGLKMPLEVQKMINILRAS